MKFFRGKIFFQFGIILVCLMGCSKDGVQKKEPIIIPATNTVGVLQYEHEVADGLTLFSVSTDTYLINNCGQVINKWVSDNLPGNSVYLLEDGSILRAGQLNNPDMLYAGGGGLIEKKSWDDELLWSYTHSTATILQHHDAYPMPNGNVMLLVVEKITAQEAIDAGRDPDKIDGDFLYIEKLVEIQPQGLNGGIVVWEWNVLDHLVQDFDSDKDNFGVVADNPQLMDFNFIDDLNPLSIDWLHTNSIAYNQDLDQVLLSVNGISEFWIIDHSTTIQIAAGSTGGIRGKGGDILYRWGNNEAYGVGDSDSQQMFRQHTPYWIPKGYSDEGNIMLFNNLSGKSVQSSSIDIVEIPGGITGEYLVNGNGYFEPEMPKWTYENLDDPEGFYSRILSNAQRLKNGNTLVCEGASGHIFEINSNKEVVWSYVNPVAINGTVTEQGEDVMTNMLFRAFKYSLDYPAFEGKELIPQDPIEINFDIGNCEQM